MPDLPPDQLIKEQEQRIMDELAKHLLAISAARHKRLVAEHQRKEQTARQVQPLEQEQTDGNPHC